MTKLTERYESCPLSSSVRKTTLRLHGNIPLNQFLRTSGENSTISKVLCGQIVFKAIVM